MRPFEGDLNKWRMRSGHMASDDSARTHGVFHIPYDKNPTTQLVVIATHANPHIPMVDANWEHVSARAFDNVNSRTPTERIPLWEEMCFLKKIFWFPEECVVQYHPPESEYVNTHPCVLHLWRRPGENMPTPPKMLVG